MAGLDLSPPLRSLAALSDFRLGLAYTAGVFPSVLLRGWAERDTSLAWLNLPAALLARNGLAWRGPCLGCGGLIRPSHARNPSSPAPSWSRLGGQEISSVPGSRYDGR
jgi:hypothetical protein